MNPYIISWPPPTTNTVVNAEEFTINVPLTFANITYVRNNSVSIVGNTPGNLVPPYGNSPRYSITPNLGTGATKPSFEMPANTVRNISLSAGTGTIEGVVFTVVGLDQNGDTLTESITGTGGTAYGTKFYKTVLSITPLNDPDTQGDTVNVGIGTSGTTCILAMDVWNKNNNYSIAYEVSSNNVSLTPYFTIVPVRTSINGSINMLSTITANPALYFQLPVANPNFIASPEEAAVIPIVENCVFSFVGLPLTGLLTRVTASTGSFSQVIIQQGGLV
jgi:hypothetical protein